MEKKRIKVKFVGFWKGFAAEKTRIYLDLSKFYDVVLSEEPDYIICSCFPPYYEYCKYPQVRIMDSSENYIPDFNLVDYAICRYPIDFLDRCFYHPGCIDFRGRFEDLLERKRCFTPDDLREKPLFANFIAGHESENAVRGDFFKLLSQYKRVDSPGSYLNNMPDGETVNWKNSSKTDFQRRCKFSLCFESTKHAGFVTEKITDAFFSDTIPVYFGSEQVFEVFNKDAMVFCPSRESFDETVRQIIALDQNDEAYLRMLNQPVFNPAFDYEKHMAEYERFIRNIFEQPPEQAYRRSRVYIPHEHEDYLLKTKEKGSAPQSVSAEERKDGGKRRRLLGGDLFGSKR